MKYNKKLNVAKTSKMDEFFTEYQTVEKELENYTSFFDGKTIYCNCDNYKTSAFFKYFLNNFERFKLKKIICTWYDKNNGGKCEYYNNQYHITQLDYDGDFRNEKNISIIKESDIIVTNPPFSLFRDFIKLMMQYNKNFIVLGNLNAVKYKDVFPHIMNNRIFIGKSIRYGDTEFIVPNTFFDPKKTKNFTIDKISGNKLVKVPSIRWYTNLKYDGFNQTTLNLVKTIDSMVYEFFDGYDNIINCDKVSNIPKDYNGIIGVPISFIDKYNSNQFKIIGLIRVPKIKGTEIYSRILIQKKEESA